MALDSSSTLAEIHAQYADNCTFEADDSASECALFVQAAELLLLKLPKQVSAAAGGETLYPNVDAIERRLREARQWQALKREAGSIVHPSFQNLR